MDILDAIIPLKDYTDEYLLDLLKSNEKVPLSLLGGICSEILRRMNEKQRLL